MVSWSGRGTVMYMLYDTRTVHPLDRYDYYRAGAGIELAPVAVHGRAPGRLLAVMSVAQIGISKSRYSPGPQIPRSWRGEPNA
jgi:hypothetical protein